MSEQAVEKESFAALLEESMGSKNNLVGQVIEGRVISVENDFALIDVVRRPRPPQRIRPSRAKGRVGRRRYRRGIPRADGK